MKKIAWLLEDGDEEITEYYRDWLPDSDIDFFRTPAQVLEHLNEGYDLFILGLVCAPEPYSYDETNRCHSVGLRLTDDIRKNTTTKNTPIVIASTLTYHYQGQINQKKLAYVEKPFLGEEFLAIINSVIPV